MGRLIIGDSLKLEQLTRRTWIRVRRAHSGSDTVSKKANGTVPARLDFVTKCSSSGSDVITRYDRRTPRIESTGAIIEIVGGVIHVLLAVQHLAARPAVAYRFPT